MAEKFVSAKIDPPRRIEILKTTDRVYWKPGQFGYAISYSTHPGMYTMDKGPSERGELAFLIAKTKDMRGGASWISSEGLRFTKPPKLDLADAERVALDLLLGNGRGDTTLLSELVPDVERRGHLKMLAAQLRSLRGR